MGGRGRSPGLYPSLAGSVLRQAGPGGMKRDGGSWQDAHANMDGSKDGRSPVCPSARFRRPGWTGALAGMGRYVAGGQRLSPPPLGLFRLVACAAPGGGEATESWREAV